jgi:flavin-dependent dehydrogenase
LNKIIIIGAGPAGSSCAIQLLKSGFEVTILDREKFPRHAPGETLHPGIEPLLKQLGVFDETQESNFLRHKGITNIQGNTSNFEYYNSDENWQGFQLFREEFDTILLNKAIKLGAKFKSGINPKKVNQADGIITSIETSDGSFEADFFIDATGKRAWLANNCNIPITQYSKKRIAYYGYVTNCQLNLSNPQLVWDKNGWTWIAQVKENLTTWVRLNLNEHTNLPDDWLPNQLADGISKGNRKAVDVTWRKADTCNRNNCFLIGDAAFVLDPGSSHGVLKAIMSGIMVAHLINESANHTKLIIENHYNQWVNEQFNSDVSKLKELYREFEIKTGYNRVDGLASCN